MSSFRLINFGEILGTWLHLEDSSEGNPIYFYSAVIYLIADHICKKSDPLLTIDLAPQ